MMSRRDSKILMAYRLARRVSHYDPALDDHVVH
jgi:hypothetical protein